MNREEIIELTQKTYKLTLLFPKKEPLRYKIREAADEVLASYLYILGVKVEEKSRFFSVKVALDLIDSYFEIARLQNWVNYFQILEIQKEYAKIKDIAQEALADFEVQRKADFRFVVKMEEKIEEQKAPLSGAEAPLSGAEEKNLDPRKEKILEILEKVGKIQVGEINKLFPDVSKRTIRRDFHKLVEQGMVERVGDKNDTFYRPKTQNIDVGQ